MTTVNVKQVCKTFRLHFGRPSFKLNRLCRKVTTQMWANDQQCNEKTSLIYRVEASSQSVE